MSKYLCTFHFNEYNKDASLCWARLIRFFNNYRELSSQLTIEKARRILRYEKQVVISCVIGGIRQEDIKYGVWVPYHLGVMTMSRL